MTERPRTYNVLNTLVRFLAFPEETMNKFALVECLVPPGAGAPPNHHAGETESFYVLEGEVGFMVEGRTFLAKAGDHVAIPEGALHAFSVDGDRPARMLIINAPGHMHDAFYTGVGEVLPEGQTDLPTPTPPDVPRVMAKAAEVGMTIVTDGAP